MMEFLSLFQAVSTDRGNVIVHVVEVVEEVVVSGNCADVWKLQFYIFPNTFVYLTSEPHGVIPVLYPIDNIRVVQATEQLYVQYIQLELLQM